MLIIEDNANTLFDETLAHLLEHKSNIDGVAYEMINVNLILTDPTRNLMCNCVRQMPMRYAVGELLWYNSCNPSWKAIEPYSKFWKNISDDGVDVNSNYGWCIRK